MKMRCFGSINKRLTFKKLASMLLAMALANRVLPVPGGPQRRTPCNFKILVNVYVIFQPVVFTAPPSKKAQTYSIILTLGGLIPTLRKSSGFIRGSSMDSLNSLTLSDNPPTAE